jgi:hypothetical protein
MEHDMELEALVEGIEAAAPHDALKQVTAAVERAERLNAVSDELVDHFVQGARASGLSWSQIGRALGVSKQAAQQRFSGPERLGRTMSRFMVELVAGVRGVKSSKFIDRFEPLARAAVVRARDEAESLLHHYVGTEHLLLGILADPGSLGARALGALGVTHPVVRARVEEIVGRGQTAGVKRLPFTPRARSALESALSEALRRSSGMVGTDDLAVALAGQDEGPAARILQELGVNLEAIRERVQAIGPEADQAPGA